jgi:predicted alpha/beta-hydrolase family hydrolase
MTSGMSEKFLIIGPDDARTTILLAHGAGAPMDSKSMTAAAAALAVASFRVARFEFSYMASRRVSGARTLPPRADTLIPEYLAAVNELAASGTIIIGGKSMGGRVASMVADDLYDRGVIAGLLCLGYPFHPPAKPSQLRTAHLRNLQTPTLICQGTRDEFGTRDEVETYPLSTRIAFLWLEDGDHDLTPRKKLSGFSAADHLATMAAAVSAWEKKLGI